MYETPASTPFDLSRLHSIRLIGRMQRLIGGKMFTRMQLFLAVCLTLVGMSTSAQAKTQRRFALLLDFNTCTVDPNNANIINCQEKDATGKPAGSIRVTFQTFIATDGTCNINPAC